MTREIIHCHCHGHLFLVVEEGITRRVSEMHAKQRFEKERLKKFQAY